MKLINTPARLFVVFFTFSFPSPDKNTGIFPMKLRQKNSKHEN